MNLYTLEDVNKMIRDEVKRLGTQKKLAETIMMQESYLSDILAGKRDPNQRILNHLGLQVEVRYARRAQQQSRADGTREDA